MTTESKKELTALGFEPRFPRPQRGVLTTRRRRRYSKAYTLIQLITICALAYTLHDKNDKNKDHAKSKSISLALTTEIVFFSIYLNSINHLFESPHGVLGFWGFGVLGI